MLRYLSSGLFLTIIFLMGVGLVQVYSSSYIFATESYGDGLYFFKKQALFTLLGFAVLVATIHCPFRWFEKRGWMLWGVALLMMILTFVPGLGVRVGGALRWLQFPGGLRFEPSELLKVSFSLLFASLLMKRKNYLSRWPWYLRLGFVAFPIGILLLQKDFGSFAIIMTVAALLLFSFGLPWKFLALGSVSLALVSSLYILTHPYAQARIQSFLNPWADPEKKGFQVIQSMLSVSSGGLSGVGLGKGQGKLFFLPEAHTDFTLAVYGEEMGFIGFAVLLGLYGFLILRGFQIAMKTENTFAKSLCLGLTLTVGFSIFINMGVVMGLLPTKGLTLPFLSYGGSSLVVLCFLFGLILNVENNLWKIKKS